MSCGTLLIDPKIFQSSNLNNAIVRNTDGLCSPYSSLTSPLLNASLGIQTMFNRLQAVNIQPTVPVNLSTRLTGHQSTTKAFILYNWTLYKFDKMNVKLIKFVWLYLFLFVRISFHREEQNETLDLSTKEVKKLHPELYRSFEKPIVDNELSNVII